MDASNSGPCRGFQREKLFIHNGLYYIFRRSLKRLILLILLGWHMAASTVIETSSVTNFDVVCGYLRLQQVVHGRRTQTNFTPAKSEKSNDRCVTFQCIKRDKA